MMPLLRRSSVITLMSVVATILGPLSAAAQTPSFKDLPSTHPAFAAVEYLKSQGFVAGYPDGTYKPDQKVNRAEAAKFLVAPLVKAEILSQVTSSVYTDIPAGAWFIPYVEAARQLLGIIDGPPKATAFRGTDPVKKVEFLKMLELANKVDPNSYGEIRLPLATDVTNPDEWFYPYVRFALTSSMIMVSAEGSLTPAAELTRGDTALLLYRFLMYQQGRRAQALLSESETEIVNTLNALEQNDIDKAEMASARALLAARGALTSHPEDPLVKAALKITESFRSLVRGYRAGVNGNLNEVVRLAGEAWNLAETAKSLKADLATVAEQVQKLAKGMADEARALLGKQP